MQLLQALNWRYAVKRFSNHAVSQHQLQTLLEATRLSPSSYGLQPYRLIVVEDTALREQLVQHSYGQDKVLNCANLIVFAAFKDIDHQFVTDHMARLTSSRKLNAATQQHLEQQYRRALVDQVDAQQRQQWIRDQTYLALGNFLTSAALLNIDACPMTGIDSQQYDQLLQLPTANLTTIAIATVGVRHPEDGYASQPKVRLSMDELVNWVRP